MTGLARKQATSKLFQMETKIDDYVFVSPRRIYLNKTKEDSVFERPIRVMTMQGPRVSLSRSDCVNEGMEIEFTITLLKHKELTWKLIDSLMEYGQLAGLGQFRNGGFGRFEVVESFDVLD